MKGSFVRELQGAAALMRAATSVMATRAKGASGGRDVEELFKTIEELQAENVRLKREMEQVKARLPPPTVPQPAALERRSSMKRRRVVEWTDSEKERKSKYLPPLTSTVDFPLLPQRKGRREAEEGRGTPRGRVPHSDGSDPEGKSEMGRVPVGLEGRGQGRARYHGRSPDPRSILDGINIQGDEGGPEFRELWEQLNSVKSKLSSLRGVVFAPPPMPTTQAPRRSTQLTLEQYVSLSVIGKEA